MAAVTQKIQNYLGGVSQQSEELMAPGQVIDALNAYVDPALGLVKRTGLEYVSDLIDLAGSKVQPTGALRKARWFPIFLGPGQNFFGCVGHDTIRVFGSDGQERSILKPDGTGYLSSIGDLLDVHVLTVNDYTFITNKKTKVTAQPAPTTFTANKVATVVIGELHYGAQYSITFRLDGVNTTITYTTFNAEDAITTPAQTERKVTANQILLGLQALLPAGYYGEILGNTMEIRRSTGTLTFTATAVGALAGTGMSIFQDVVSDISRLPGKAHHFRLVKIENSNLNQDNYWVRFIANNGISGDGYWTEWVDPTVSPGFDTTTAPHTLIYNRTNDEFIFSRGLYVERLVGDDTTNPQPSFVDKEVKAVFFYNNRLGFLTEETIVMSQTNDFFNFYANSAITVVDTDPIDKSVSSITPVRLFGAVPQPQGLILFGDNQQFLVDAADGVFTPASTTIKSISIYQADPHVSPIDMGVTVGFTAKSGAYTRLFEMLSRGENEQPEVVELTKIVPEWLPADINTVVSSPQAGVVIAGTVDSDTENVEGRNQLYVLRYWQEGQIRNQAWTRWEFPETIMMLYLDQETLWVVLNGEKFVAGQPSCYPLCKINLNQQSRSDSSVNYTFTPQSSPVGLAPLGKVIKAEPRLDYFIKIPSNYLRWDAALNGTRVYFPPNYSAPDTSLFLNSNYGLGNCVITTNPIGTETYAGLFKSNLNVALDVGPGPFAGQPFVLVQGVDLTTISSTVVYGILYTCGLELPQVYFRVGEQETSDYTASLTVHRMKFLYGVTGPMQYLLRTRGSTHNTQIKPIPEADYYIEGTVPITDSAVFTVPIHQKNTNFSIRLDAPTSYPLTLQSSSWEGNYTPRFYRRT